MMRAKSVFQIGTFLVIAALFVNRSAAARNSPKHGKDLPQDRIDVLANVVVGGGPITRITVTRHFSRTYLYLEHASHALTLVDATDDRHPNLVGDLEVPAAERGSILMAAGDAALISSGISNDASPKTSTMTIVNFADRTHPRTIRQFVNVTCTATDDQRGLVFVANDDGIWILHRNPADDPEVQERYAHEVLYNH